MLKKTTNILGVSLLACIFIVVFYALFRVPLGMGVSHPAYLILNIIESLSILGIIALSPLIIGSYFVKKRSLMYVVPVSAAAVCLFFVFLVLFGSVRMSL